MKIPAERSAAYRPKKKAMVGLRRRIESTLVRSGAAGARVLSFLRAISWAWSNSRWKLTALISPALRNIKALGIEPDAIYWISPSMVEYCSHRGFWITDKGRVIGGDWDALDKRFEDLDIYVAMKEVCLEGRDWEETVFYQRFYEEVRNGGLPWGCRDAADISLRLQFLESLYESIKTDGYQSRDQLRRLQRYHHRGEDEVAICIGRDGDLLFGDGAHRLAAAKLIGIETMPVKISVRHPNWIAFREELLSYAAELGGSLKQPALHPDLKNIPFERESETRLDTIHDHLPSSYGNALDIGANIGYHSHRLEELGFTCYALETSERELYFLKKLRAIGNKKFTICEQTLLNSRQLEEVHFDVVLWLNASPGRSNTGDSQGSFIDLIQSLHADEAFLAPNLASDSSLRGAQKSLRDEEFIQLVQDGLEMKYSRIISKPEDGRSIFHLSKKPRCG